MTDQNSEQKLKELQAKLTTLKTKFNAVSTVVRFPIISIAASAVAAALAVNSAPLTNSSDKALLGGGVFIATFIASRVGRSLGSLAGLLGGGATGGVVGGTGGLAVGIATKRPLLGTFGGTVAGGLVGAFGGAILGAIGGYGAGIYYGQKYSNEFIQQRLIAPPQTQQKTEADKEKSATQSAAIVIDWAPRVA